MYSKYSIVLIFIIHLFFLHYFGNWSLNAGGGDSWGYYGYLPATFIHHDLGTLEKSIEARVPYAKYQDFIDNGNPLRIDEAKHLGDGKQVMKYSMGIAILIFPFFILAHFLALLLDLPADGYSSIYLYFSNHASLFYVLMGLYFIRKVLLDFVDDKTVAFTLIALGIATNVFFFTTYNPTMSHTFLFGLYGALIYSTVQFYKKPSYGFGFAIGLLCGLITLSRPVEIICLIIPLFYGLKSKSDFGKRFSFFKTHWKKLLLSASIYSAIGSIQMIYWKWATGSLIYYSYEEEGFDFKHPHIYEGLLGFRNGWLPYTPIMFLAIFGFYFLWKKRDFAWPVLLYFPLHVYIIYSWWCWNYINGFGSRPMIEAYPLLSIPFAFMVHFLLKRKWTQILFGIIFMGCIYLNFTHTFQIHNGLMYCDHGTKNLYWNTFGKHSFTYNDYVSNDLRENQPNPDKLNKIKTILYDDFNDTLDHVNFVCEDPPNCTDTVFYFNQKIESSKKISVSYNDSGIKEGDWIKVSARLKTTARPNSSWDMAHIVCHFEGDQMNRWKGLKFEHKIGGPPYTLWTGKPNVWETMSFYTKAPKKKSENQKVTIYVWQPKDRFIFVDDLKAEIYRNK